MTIKLVHAEWPAPKGIFAATTTRSGGVSEGPWKSLNLGAHAGDRPDAVAENRRRLVDEAGLAREPVWLQQVHGTRVVRAEDGPPQEADAVVSTGRPIGVLTADCLPVLLCSSAGDEIAALHCGWRSLSGGIVANTVDAMRSVAGDLMAWLGPAISQPAFEVGDEVRDIFLAGVEDAASCFLPNENGRWQADLYGLARRYLAAAGVPAVFGGGFCTRSDEDAFFSYRRDGETGRMATVIARF